MNDAIEQVILVDQADRPLGVADKLLAHQQGQLHRAFSVLIHDGAGNVLLQRRAPGKYHSGGLWTNACCGHPRPGEPTDAAATRRLAEEMGFACELRPLRQLVYRADVGSDLTEHEYVHVFGGCWTGAVNPDPEEADSYAWRPLSGLHSEVTAKPEQFTAWFRIYLDQSIQAS